MYYPVTGNNDGELVVAIRSSDSTLSTRMPYPFSEPRIANRLAVGDFEEIIPDGKLERRAALFQRGQELHESSIKILTEFTGYLVEVSVSARNDNAAEQFLKSCYFR